MINDRYKNVCIFWIDCEQKILNDRLDKRVDEMMKVNYQIYIYNFEIFF